MAICDNCRGILIQTFKFNYAEFYCMACGSKFGFLGRDKVVATSEMIDEHRKLKAQFDEIAEPIVFWGCQKRDCNKCVGSVHHVDHMTQQEKDDHQKALDKLYSLATKRI